MSRFGLKLYLLAAFGSLAAFNAEAGIPTRAAVEALNRPDSTNQSQVEADEFSKNYELEPIDLATDPSNPPDIFHLLRRKIKRRKGDDSTYYVPKVEYGAVFTGPSDYQEGESRSFPPASTNKIFTTALALHELGGDYTFDTPLAWVRSEDITEAGYLTFVGAGDFSLESTDLPKLAQEYVAGIFASGVRKIYGELRFAATDNRWSTKTVPEGWLARDLKSESGFIPDELGTLTRTKIKAALRAKLAEAGVTWLDTPAPFPENEKGIQSVIHRSPPLRELIQPFVQNSVNYKGEALLRKVGELKGAQTAPDLHTAGLTVLREFVSSMLSPDVQEGVLLYDGSGLSRKSRITAKAMAQFLTLIEKEPYFSNFYAALPTAGETGTLKARMNGTPAEGRVHAKTGTLDGNYPLAGYLEEKKPNGTEYHPFVILNETKEASSSYCRLVEDGVLSELATWMLAGH